MRHLGLDHWERVILRDELDLLGPIATRRLVEHGLVWPPTIHADVPALERLRGGCLVDGEGGDEVLGMRAPSHRSRHALGPVAATAALAPRQAGVHAAAPACAPHRPGVPATKD